MFGTDGPLDLPPLVISPLAPTVPITTTQLFVASGGSGDGYVFTLTVNNSGGGITTGGLYTAGSTPSVVDTVTVTDSFGNTASTTINVALAIAGIVVTPPDGTEISPTQVFDAQIVLGFTTSISAFYGDSDVPEVVFSSGTFTPRFAASTRTSIFAGFEYVIRRFGGWPASPVRLVFATVPFTASFEWPIEAPAETSGPVAHLPPGQNDPLGNGIVRPFRRTVLDDFATASGVSLVMSDIGQLLGTPIRRLPWQHDFGADLQPLRQKNNSEILTELARTRIEQAIRKWARNVELRSVRAEREAAPGHIGKNVLVLAVTLVVGGQVQTMRVPV